MSSQASSRHGTPAAVASDPAQVARRLLRERRAARASTPMRPADSTGGTGSSGNLRDGEPASPTPEESTHPRNSQDSTAIHRRRARSPDDDLEEYAMAIKRQKTLSAAAEGDLIVFAKGGPGAAGRRQVLAYTALLEIRDALAKIPRSAENVDSNMKTIIRHFARMLLFSSDITVYRGNGKSGSPAAMVLDIMRVLKTTGLPPARQADQVKKFLGVIGNELTQFRHLMKATIEKSIKEDSPLRNIAALTHFLCPDGSITTLAHYQRIAFIRWHVLNYPNLASDQFWVKVDETIRENLADGLGIAQDFFDLKYDEDITKFGAPEDDMDHTAASVTERSHDQTIVEDRSTHLKMAPVGALTEPEEGLPFSEEAEEATPGEASSP